MFKNKLHDIRARINRRNAALLLAFAVGLTYTGVSSLAVIHDNVTIAISGTATTLDFRANGEKNLAIDFGLVLRGDIQYVPLHLTNSGTGYVSIDSPDAIAVTNGTEISDTTKLSVWENVPASGCNASSGFPINWSTTGTVGTVPIFSGTKLTINAGDSKDICAIYQVGGDASLGAFPTNGTVLDLLYRLNGYYP